MSVAEIQDNKWEVQASKPPLANFGAIGVIIMMGSFFVFFVWIIVFSVIGAFTEPTGGKNIAIEKTQKAEPKKSE